MAVHSEPTVAARDPSAGMLHRARGWAYGLIAESFRWPDSRVVQSLHDPASWSDGPEVLPAAYPQTAAPLARLRESALAVRSHRELESDHIRLFGHTVRGLCPLYELEFGGGEVIQQAAFLADIAGFYAAFGLEPAAGGQERQDHLSAECEFMAVLAVQEAHAVQGGDAGGREVVRGAQAAFLAEHLGRWLPACMRRVREASPEGFYAAAAAFAACFLNAECAALGVRVGAELMELRNAEPASEEDIRCGVEENCPGAEEDDLVQIRMDPALGGGS